MGKTTAEVQPSSAGVTDLHQLVLNMDPVLDSRTFAFVFIDEEQLSEYIFDALMFIREDEGVTLILDESLAKARGLPITFQCRRITLQIHSSLDAVGFLAALLPALAQSGMGVNPVSGFFHDHLFLPAERAEEALGILHELKNRHDPATR